MATVRVRVEGLSEIKRKLDRLPGHVSGRVLAASMMRAAEPIRAAAEANAPKRTGRLARGMEKDVEEQRSDRAVVAVGPEEDDFHGLYQEFGTRFHQAQPFLEPAFDAKAREAIRIAGRELGRKVEQAAR